MPDLAAPAGVWIAMGFLVTPAGGRALLAFIRSDFKRLPPTPRSWWVAGCCFAFAMICAFWLWAIESFIGGPLFIGSARAFLAGGALGTMLAAAITAIDSARE